MVFLRVLLILIVLIVVQSTLAPLMKVKGIVPDWLLIFLVYWSGRHSRTQGVVVGFFGGLLQDFVVGGVVGVLALSKSVACYLSSSLSSRRYERNLLLMGAMLFTAAFVHQLIFCVFIYHGAAAGFLPLFLRYGIPSAFYTVFCGVFSYGVIGWLVRRRGGRSLH